jgi:hypothetical protein
VSDPPVVVLGHQHAHTGAGQALAALNAELAVALHPCGGPEVVGLLAYQVLRNVDEPDRFCVYWLWEGPGDRDALWAHPPDALRRFWRLARPLWRSVPVVGHYSWWPDAVRDLCAPSTYVHLSGGSRPGDPEPSTRWLVPLSSDSTLVRVRVGDDRESDAEQGRSPGCGTPMPAAQQDMAREAVPGRWALVGPHV